jgi:transcriptional regulator with XRE-family HTH domain
MPTPLATRLLALREKSSLSQRSLAKLAGISPSYPFHIETSKVEHIGVEVAEKLARVLGCSPEFLLVGAGEAPDEDVVRAAVEEAGARADVGVKGAA